MRFRLIAALLVTSVLQAQSKPAADTRPVTAEPPPAGDPSAYASLFKFCPEKLESLMLVTSAGLPDDFKEFGLAQGDFRGDDTKLKCVRCLQVARKFTDRWDSECVRIYELEKPIALADVLNEEHFHYESIGGVPCFVAKPKSDEMDWGPLEDWVTLVDRKYLIFATRRAMLKEALARKGPTAEVCIERLGWKLSDVRFGSPLVIVRKFEGAKGQKPPAIERLNLFWDPASKRCLLDVVSKESAAAALRQLRAMVGDSRGESRPAGEAELEEEHAWGWSKIDPVSSNGGLHTFALTIKKAEYDWAWNQAIYMIFGYQTGQ
jgi:hypothetical protein